MRYFWGVANVWLLDKEEFTTKEGVDTVVKCADKLRGEIDQQKACYDDEERAESTIEK